MSDPHRDDGVTILVVRTGGLAGLRRRWRVDAEADAAEPWVELIERCPWDAPDETDATASGTADRYVWSVRARAPEIRHEREIPEPALTGPWRELIDAVRAAGATGDGPPCAPRDGGAG